MPGIALSVLYMIHGFCVCFYNIPMKKCPIALIFKVRGKVICSKTGQCVAQPGSGHGWSDSNDSLYHALYHAKLPCSKTFSFTVKLIKKNELQCQHKCNFKIFFHWFVKCFAYNIINLCIPIVLSAIHTFPFSFLSGPC